MNQNHIIFTPARIAALVAQPDAHVYEPSDEQKLVITAPQHTPLLVVAGAGSGKTETMSQRVIWLIANGFVSPEEVLGLTFTRKAAGELSERMRIQLHRLRETLPESPEAKHGDSQETVQRVISLLDDHLSAPVVATYNSFAGSLISEFGEHAGMRADSVIIDDATAWQICREVVNSATDKRLIDLDANAATIVDLVLKLNRALNDHLVTADKVEQLEREFATLAELPYNDKGDTEKSQPDLLKALASVAKLPTLLELAETFAAEKVRRGVLEFSDQLPAALNIVTASDEVRNALRERYPVVLLDEYQDTSVGQTKLLASLFAGHGVTAVGDPHQSIYGWRGASAANLADFATQFLLKLPPLSLSTSWRNSVAVLDAANVLVAPLSSESPVSVKSLTARPDAPPGEVHTRVVETVVEEAVEIAQWLTEKRNTFAAKNHRNPTCAIIFRQRALMPLVSEMLTEHAVPHEIVGVGGLLTSPEITDMICVLRCLWRIDAGSELIRLLAGPRWRVGVADLQGLQDAAHWLSKRDHTFSELTTDERQAQRRNALPNTEATILEALDVICAVGDDHRITRDISPLGVERLRDAGAVLARLRSRTAAPLGELVRQIELELRLDIELVANESRHQNGGKRARANLDAFYDLVDNFVSIDDEGNLPNLLSWLDRAVRDDAAAEQTAEPNPEAVQLITVHGAKGLEWDYVVVPRMVEDEFPSRPKGLSGWLGSGELPFELRGDAVSQPHLNWRSARTKLEYKAIEAQFKDEMREHLGKEERRLGYVALTRAKEALLLTASYWSSQTKPRMPSVFLRELASAGLIPEPAEARSLTEPPEAAPRSPLTWPIDPLGRRGERVRAAADTVSALLEHPEFASMTPDIERFPQLALLLAERDRAAQPPKLPAPDRVSASAYKDFVTDPKAARQKMRRPMPERPYRQAKVGTIFHQWVERRYASAAGSAEVLSADDFVWEDNDTQTDIDDAMFSTSTELERLKRHFEESEWGTRAPLAVEQEITIPFAGRRLVCKIDAVYQTGENAYEIVDWKTGKPPQTSDEKALRSLQLELYRHAFAAFKKTDPANITCALFYVSTGEVVRVSDHTSFEELEQRWIEAFGEVS